MLEVPSAGHVAVMTADGSPGLAGLTFGLGDQTRHSTRKVSSTVGRKIKAGRGLQRTSGGGGTEPCNCCFHCHGWMGSLDEEALVSPDFLSPLYLFICIWRGRLLGLAPRGAVTLGPGAG